MVRNSTNINKNNNHHSHQLIEHNKDYTCDVGNTGPICGQAQHYGGVKPVNQIPTFPS